MPRTPRVRSYALFIAVVWLAPRAAVAQGADAAVGAAASEPRSAIAPSSGAPDPAIEQSKVEGNRQSTDPTEPVTSSTLLTFPQPEGPREVPGQELAPEEEEEEETTPGDPWGDVGPGGLLSFRALMQARYMSTFAASSTSSRDSYRVREDYLVQQGDGFSFNRLFLRVASDPLPYLGFKLILDFSELIADDAEDVVKQAFAVFRPIPKRLELTVGMFKIPVSVLELDASSRYEFTDFGDTNRLLGDLGFAGRDLGVQVRVAPLKKPKRLRISAGVFRGHMHDEHDSPAGIVAARIETKPNKRLRFGANFAQHTKAVTYDRPFNTSDRDELPDPPDPLYPAQRRWDKGHAFTADARFKRKGFMVRAEFSYGDRVDLDERYGAETFWGAWGIVAYRIDVGAVRLLPALRYEWLDADREHAIGARHQYTAALNVLFWERVRMIVDARYVDLAAGTIVLNQPRPLQLEPFLALDHLRLTAQLQVEL